MTQENKSELIEIVKPIEYLNIAERIDSIKNHDEMTKAIREIRAFIVALSVQEQNINGYTKRRMLLGNCIETFSVLEIL